MRSVQSQEKDSPELIFAGATDQDLERVIGRIRSQLLILRKEQTAISKRITMIKTTITGLARVFGCGVLHQELQTLLSQPRHRCPRARLGLTEMCRKSLRESLHPLTLPEILERIREKCPEVLANHKNPRVSLNVVLKRLVNYSEAERILSAEGSRAWKWASTHQLEATNRNGTLSH